MSRLVCSRCGSVPWTRNAYSCQDYRLTKREELLVRDAVIPARQDIDSRSETGPGADPSQVPGIMRLHTSHFCMEDSAILQG